MTDDEQTILQTYLLRIAAISTPTDFEEWYRISTDTEDGKAATEALLDQARAYDLGLRDAKLQAEAWVEGIDRTYNLILGNMTKEIMAERTRKGVDAASTPSVSETGSLTPAWLYLPVGPEGPRPWPDGANLHMAD